MSYSDPDKQREYQRKWINKKNKERRTIENRSDGSVNLGRGGFVTWEELHKDNFDNLGTWNECVKSAKGYIHGRRLNRLLIAAIAMRACIIKQGGARKKDISPGETLTAFAKEINVHRKTLSDWVRIRRNIINNLPESLKQIDYTAAKQASDELRKSPDKSPQELYEKYATTDTGERSAMWITHMLRSAATHINNYGNRKFNKENLKEALISAKTIYFGLKE